MLLLWLACDMGQDICSHLHLQIVLVHAVPIKYLLQLNKTSALIDIALFQHTASIFPEMSKIVITNLMVLFHDTSMVFFHDTCCI